MLTMIAHDERRKLSILREVIFFYFYIDVFRLLQQGLRVSTVSNPLLPSTLLYLGMIKEANIDLEIAL